MKVDVSDGVDGPDVVPRQGHVNQLWFTWLYTYAVNISAELFLNNKTVWWPIIRDDPGKLAPEPSETLTKYTTIIILKFLSSTLNFLSQASSLPLRWSDAKKNV